MNNINTIEGGTHVVGFRSALTRTLTNYAEKEGLTRKTKASVTGEDVREGLTAVVSVKMQNPQFEGQTKTKLGNSEIKGAVESIVGEGLREYFEENPSIARKIVDKMLAAARAREAARKARELARRKTILDGGSLPGQARRLRVGRPGAVRDLHRRGRLGRRHRQAGPRPALPGHPAHPRQDPERREGPHRQDPRERGDPQHHHRARRRGEGRVRHHQAALPPDHPDDRRRRRRRAHPHAAADVPVPRAAGRSSTAATSTSPSRRCSW